MLQAVRATRRLLRSRENSLFDGRIQEGGFSCYTDTMDNNASPLTVQAGDVIGACVFNPEDDGLQNVRIQLDVVGESSPVSSLLATSADGCSMDALPSNISVSQLSVLGSKRLHIHANVGMCDYNCIYFVPY